MEPQRAQRGGNYSFLNILRIEFSSRNPSPPAGEGRGEGEKKGTP